MAGYKPLKQSLANENSRVREAIFLHKLSYDLKVAGIAVGAHLHIYTAEVDEVGVDITVEWGYGLRKFQLKTVAKDSSTSRWSIHPSLLKPTMWDEAERGIIEWQYFHPFGSNGGVILIELDWTATTPKVRYSCTDLFLLMMLRDGVLTGKSCVEARDALQQVAASEGSSRRKVDLTKRCFLRAATPTALLELMSMPSSSTTSWKQQFFRIYCAKERRRPGPSIEAATELIRKQFGTLTVPAPEHIWRD